MAAKEYGRGWREERPIWIIGIIMFALLFSIWIIDRIAPDFLKQSTPSCFVRQHVGMYCTGCGATRAVLAVLRGNVLQSLYYNVAVMYVIVFYGAYVIRGWVYLLTKGKYKYMKFHVAYVFIGLGIVVLQAVVKNVALYVYHYTWMT